MKFYNLARQWLLYFFRNRNSNWTYKILKNCPTPPQKFIDLARTGDRSFFGLEPESANYEPEKNPRLNRMLVKPSKADTEPSVRNPRYELGPEFTEWLQKNMFSNFDETVVSISHQGDGRSFGPHTDRWRCYALMYIVDPGGAGAATTFWKEKFYPDIRDGGVTINDYTDLVEIDSVVLKAGQWVILQARTLHSVEHIDHIRIAFQISVNDLSELERFF